MQVDLRDQPSGQYDFTVNLGRLRFNGEAFAGSSQALSGTIAHVNTIGSQFGSGWGLAGLGQIVENPDGSVLLIDGDGSELLFGKPTTAGQPFVSPRGDFSVLERTAKYVPSHHEGADGPHVRSGQSLGHHSRPQRKCDAFRLRPRRPARKDHRSCRLGDDFCVVQGRITTITDPAGRMTQLEYDQAGNLKSITDPDGSRRTWTYDGDRHIISETDQRGQREETSYHFSGRAIGSLRKDGSSLRFNPVQIQGLLPPQDTVDPLSPPLAVARAAAEAVYADGNGNVVRTTMDQSGQPTASFDDIGPLPTIHATRKTWSSWMR